MTDEIVFDIETKDTFADVGGKQNLKQLSVSVVGMYSYEQDTYVCYDEYEMNKVEELLRNAKVVVGFSSKRFDVPVLDKYLKLNFTALNHYDILEQIEQGLGRRVGLDILAQANIGEGKSSHGLEAVNMYARGDMEELKSYCLQDVAITKKIFDLIRERKYLWIPNRNMPQMTKLPVEYHEPEQQQSALI